MAVVMIVGVMPYFEMTFTSDLLKVAWESNDFVFKLSITHKKFGYGPLKNSREQPAAILVLLFCFCFSRLTACMQGNSNHLQQSKR